MDFPERKNSFKPIIDYLRNENCTIEQLLGLKASLQALDVAVDRGLKRVHWKKNKLKTKLRIDDDMSWLD